MIAAPHAERRRLPLPVLKRAARLILDETCRCSGSRDPLRCSVCWERFVTGDYGSCCGVCRVAIAREILEGRFESGIEFHGGIAAILAEAVPVGVPASADVGRSK